MLSSKMTLLFGSCAFPCYVSEVQVFKMQGNEQFVWIQHTYPESRLQASFINQLADYHFRFLKPPHLNINTYIYTHFSLTTVSPFLVGDKP